MIFVAGAAQLPAEPEPRHATGFKTARALLGGIRRRPGGDRPVRGGRPLDQPLHIDLLRPPTSSGHGANGVNVLLVDTSAPGTLGEISVLIVAATGVSVAGVPQPPLWCRTPSPTPLATARPPAADRTRAPDYDDVPPGPVPPGCSAATQRPRHRSMVLEATTRLIFPPSWCCRCTSSAGSFAGGGFARRPDDGAGAGVALPGRWPLRTR